MESKRIKGNNTFPGKSYSESFKKMVVGEFERGILNADQVRIKYGIGGHGCVLRWCRKYGKLHYPEKGTRTGRHMKDPVQRRIKELEEALAAEKLKVSAFRKLIQITEREEGISILKKDEAKQLKSLGRTTPEK